MMNVFEAAKYLGLSVAGIRKLARASKIPAGKIGQQWRFDKGALDAFLKNQYRG